MNRVLKKIFMNKMLIALLLAMTIIGGTCATVHAETRSATVVTSYTYYRPVIADAVAAAALGVDVNTQIPISHTYGTIYYTNGYGVRNVNTQYIGFDVTIFGGWLKYIDYYYYVVY